MDSGEKRIVVNEAWGSGTAPRSKSAGHRHLRRPCAVSIKGDYAAVAELQGRVVVTDKTGKIVATLGDNPDQKQWAAFKLAPEFWQDGIFIAPHGVAFDAAGNIFVQDWNYIGRLTKLRRAPGLALAN